MEVTPSSGKTRVINHDKIRPLIDHYNKTGSLKPGDYSAMTRHASYFTALMQIIEGIDDSLQTEMLTHGVDVEKFTPDEEGRKIIKQHITYERSKKNRRQAIKIHGTRCLACGFDFNDVYGADWARKYIEMHHTRSIAGIDGPVDPETDLIPLCSNCHSMAHRKTGEILALEEIKSLIAENTK